MSEILRYSNSSACLFSFFLYQAILRNNVEGKADFKYFIASILYKRFNSHSKVKYLILGHFKVLLQNEIRHQKKGEKIIIISVNLIIVIIIIITDSAAAIQFSTYTF
jgi:hypothetical protein